MTGGTGRDAAPSGRTACDGDDYERHFDALAASGADVHGPRLTRVTRGWRNFARNCATPG
ncbi:hypothetical protein [Saccharopolyspora sp. ASAGF58]|uniref:hypothetical protein n=1 Tax=Saccharopolyspora sp. ASAGF58 TaxID=2719023 RepID=UPI001B306845|nr:hypothetical protein [Saccharopolyspora sp. ASAGF58]